jgi:rhodanese-related sulfurtransferase
MFGRRSPRAGTASAIAWIAGTFTLVWTLLAALGGPALGGHAGMVNTLDVDYIQGQYASGRKLTSIDLRSASEYRQGRLPGARSLPLDELTTRFAEVPRTHLVVLYCDCARSEVEAAYWFLRRQGHRNLSILDPGFTAWVQRGYPVER